jgi:hypothetical protein
MRTDAAEWYQPHTYIKEPGKKKRRVSIGDPIPDYYPVVASPTVFQRARDHIRGRLLSRARGYTGPIYNNLLILLRQKLVSSG